MKGKAVVNVGADSPLVEICVVRIRGLFTPSLRVRNRMVRLERLRQLRAPLVIMKAEMEALKHAARMLERACCRFCHSRIKPAAKALIEAMKATRRV